MILRPLPPTFAATRATLQRVAAHVLARRRSELSGRFGLRASPGGIATPAAGPEHEVVRIAGATLVRETTGEGARTATLDLRTASLADAARLVGVDLLAPFVVGHDTPPLGDTDAPLGVDPAAALALADWFALGCLVLDAVVAGLGDAGSPSVVQLWPEHFDTAVDVAAAPGVRTNLGASPGDGASSEPYLYVGPWDPGRPGDPAYWNAPFGAALGYERLRAADDPLAAGVDFLRRGVALLRQGPG